MTSTELTTTFPIAIAALLQNGAHIRRKGWRNKFHLELENYEVYSSPVIVRVDEAATFRNPWGVVTEDDTLASDWEIIPNTATTEIPKNFQPAEGTYASALQALLAGSEAIRMVSGWHPSMQLRMADGQIKIDDQIIKMGKVLVLRLPSGEWKYWRPAPQDLAGIWTIVEEEDKVQLK